MRRIALVGDIGSGKTFFSKLFRFPVFNADLVVSNLYRKDKFLFQKIKKKFPNNVTDFPLKKNELLKIVLQKQKNLKVLGKIVHPLVRKNLPRVKSRMHTLQPMPNGLRIRQVSIVPCGPGNPNDA